MNIKLDSCRLTRNFQTLVAIDSPSGGERQMAEELTCQLQTLGFTVSEDEAGKKINGNCGNLYGYLPGAVALPPLLLCAHMDTVAPAHGKRAIVEADGTIHSAGDTVLGADDLSAVAAILEALTALNESGIPHRGVEVLFSVAEETYCTGAAVFDFGKIRSREAYVLDYEGPLGAAVIAAPTILNFTACISGRAAHAGFAPERGISAIVAAAKAIQSIKSGRISPSTTLNFGTIAGGLAPNIVSPNCTVQGEIRSADHDRALEQMALVRHRFETVCADMNATLHFEERSFIRAYQTPETAPVVQRYFRVCRQKGYVPQLVGTFGGSDNNILAEHGIQGIVLPCAMHDCHSCGENTSVSELSALAQLVIELLLEQE